MEWERESPGGPLITVQHSFRRIELAGIHICLMVDNVNPLNLDLISDLTSNPRGGGCCWREGFPVAVVLVRIRSDPSIFGGTKQTMNGKLRRGR